VDEYANADGETAPPSWSGSFQRAMMERFFGLIDPELRPREENVHFPTREKLGDYSPLIEDLGGADVCYGGIGWCGHVAFWESHLGAEFEGDLEAYKQAGARLVGLHPMTIMQNALHSFGGDWSWVPPKANTIGPREILGARHRSFWLDGVLGGGVSWQRFIARLVAQGPRIRVRARVDPPDGAHRLHDPRRRRRRRRDPHSVGARLWPSCIVRPLATRSPAWSTSSPRLSAHLGVPPV
jgi:glucosamine-6-phosphate deaminase